MLKWQCKKCRSSANNGAPWEEFKSMFAKLYDRFTTMEDGIMKRLESHKAEIDEQVSALADLTKQNSSSITNHETQLNEIKAQIHNLNKINNLGTINIFGVPTSESGDKNHDFDIVIWIAKFYNVSINKNYIHYVRRLSNTTASKSPPPITVKFVSREISINILREYFKSSKQAVLKDILDVDLVSKIYIAEHLTKQLLKVYRECCRLKKLNVIAKVHTRNGNVYASENSNKDSRMIKFNSIEEVHKQYPLNQIANLSTTISTNSSSSSSNPSSTITNSTASSFRSYAIN